MRLIALYVGIALFTVTGVSAAAEIRTQAEMDGILRRLEIDNIKPVLRAGAKAMMQAIGPYSLDSNRMLIDLLGGGYQEINIIGDVLHICLAAAGKSAGAVGAAEAFGPVLAR